MRSDILKVDSSNVKLQDTSCVGRAASRYYDDRMLYTCISGALDDRFGPRFE
jgi:hypothetical protein